ncbi:hypothetical protein Mal35_33360 [Gimesia maris]|uniref:DUF1501 domain-containing protein n=1 Tax=Gimesia maris TaxID=122 RepID=UPI00118D0B8E|nr:DUF1501 domain-containing protein [Gimesia maris]QDT79867.1 hypothetical protein Mal35_33360 [Gimesia maris]
MAGKPCSGPVNRREFMRIGSLCLGGLSLSQLLALRSEAGQPRQDTSVILLFLHGGPSQLETYDLKPEAPSDYRSLFNPIATNVPGMDICELFPRQAKIADKFSLVRSLHHDVGIHSDGGIIVLTGKRPSKLDPSSGSKSEHPDFGSVTSAVRGLSGKGTPPYVSIPSKFYMVQPTYLGLQHGPFESTEPSSANYRPPSLKLQAGLDGQHLVERRQLLRQIDRLRNDLDLNGDLAGNDKFRDLAFQMLTSPDAASSFEIDREPDSLRDRYGRNMWGQGCLLARRLAESGCGVVSLFFNTPKNGQEFTNWDDHILNAGRPGHFAKYMKVRLPYMDQALATLIEDIHERSLEKKIMVVAVGEFGRTPRLSSNNSGTGRNHWPQAYTALFSGGNLKMGQVVGATNSKAEYPTHSPCTPQDMLATIYQHLGIDFTQSLVDHQGRPIPILPHGKPIAELI